MPFKNRPPFFLVWNNTTGYTKVRHRTPDSAQKEAQRMADIHPESKFHVLMSLGRCTADITCAGDE